jgi:hypothetical protein
LALLCSACASNGTNFAKPSPGFLVLGQTTETEVVGKMGPPTSRITSTRLAEPPERPGEAGRPPALRHADVSGDFEQLRYSYSKAHPDGPTGDLISQGRHLYLTFYQGRLIRYLFTSSFPEDETKFDDARISSFVRGTTTKDDVIRALGAPGGEAIYPYVAKQGTKLIAYSYSFIGLRNGGTLIAKQLDLLFDTSDRLEETAFFDISSVKRSSAPSK